MEGQKQHPRAFSFEFFPPKTSEGAQKLGTTWRQLAQLKPRFFSVTYGAGGSTRERTLSTVIDIRQAGFHAAPHVSCIGSTRADIAQTLELYRARAIRHIVALRGDLPSGAASAGELRQLTPGGAQFLHALGRLGREELEAESARVLLLAFHVPARQYLYESDL